MKLNELFAKIVNLDATKEYDVVETQSHTESTLQQTQSQESVQNQQVGVQQQDTSTSQSSTVELPEITQLKAEFEKLKQQKETLEAANFALLNRLPVQTPQKTFEENIMEIAKKGGMIYGISDTSDRSQS